MLKKALVMFLVATASHAMAQHIENIGQPQSVSPVPSTMQVDTDIVGAAKVILPSEWKGFAKTGMDSRRPSFVSVVSGEPWTSALDRWVANEGLSAKLDWVNKRLYLDQVSAPKARNASLPMPSYTDLGKLAPASQQAVAPAASAAAPPPVAAPPAVAQVSKSWSVLVNDVRLETTLERWAKQAGYTLIWDADRHVLITAEDSFEGSFEAALNRVLSSPAIRESDYPLEAVFYANNPPVLRITGLGEQTSK